MKRSELFLLLGILIIAAFLRLWRISEYMTFLGDEGRDALVVRDMILGAKYTLIGPGTSIGNMYLGPFYYYMMIIPLALAGFSPVGPAVQIAVLGVATVAFLWWIARTWLGKKAAFLISLLYAISPTVITYSRSSWNPNIMPFFALLTIYSLWAYYRYQKYSWLIVTSVSFAFVLNSHYLGLLLFPVILIFWFFSRKSLKHTTFNLILFLVLMSPLLFFDLRHNFSNFQSIRIFFTNRQTTVNARPYKALPNMWPIWLDINSSLVTAKDKNLSQVTALLGFGSLAIALYIYAGRHKEIYLLALWLGFAVLGLGLYKQHIYDHYYGFIFPAVFLCLGLDFRLLDRIPKLGKLLSAALFLYLVFVNLRANVFWHEPNRQLERTKEISRFINNVSGNKPYNLALLAKTNYDASYRYELSLLKSPYYTIHDHLSDQLFVICEITGPDAEKGCSPINNPLWEIAAFGWAKIDTVWDFPWGTRLFKLVHNPSGV